MFQKTMLEIANGATVGELNDALQKVVAAVRQTGKRGKLTLDVTVSPAAKGATDVLMIEAQVKTRLPEPERGMTIFYATDDNRLVRNDPKQPTLDLRVVDIGDQPKQLKEVV